MGQTGRGLPVVHPGPVADGHMNLEERHARNKRDSRRGKLCS
jgi:hypothetical protein